MKVAPSHGKCNNGKNQQTYFSRIAEWSTGNTESVGISDGIPAMYVRATHYRELISSVLPAEHASTMTRIANTCQI